MYRKTSNRSPSLPQTAPWSMPRGKTQWCTGCLNTRRVAHLHRHYNFQRIDVCEEPTFDHCGLSPCSCAISEFTVSPKNPVGMCNADPLFQNTAVCFVEYLDALLEARFHHCSELNYSMSLRSGLATPAAPAPGPGKADLLGLACPCDPGNPCKRWPTFAMCFAGPMGPARPRKSVMSGSGDGCFFYGVYSMLYNTRQ
jgi:hypothetical protein